MKVGLGTGRPWEAETRGRLEWRRKASVPREPGSLQTCSSTHVPCLQGWRGGLCRFPLPIAATHKRDEEDSRLPPAQRWALEGPFPSQVSAWLTKAEMLSVITTQSPAPSWLHLPHRRKEAMEGPPRGRASKGSKEEGQADTLARGA